MPLEDELQRTNCIGQISTPQGEEILCTSNDTETTSRLSQLTTAFIETDTLARSLKLGSIQRVITSTTNKDKQRYSVQSKCVKQQTNDGEEEEVALLNTVVGESLQGVMVADGIMKETTQQIL